MTRRRSDGRGWTLHAHGCTSCGDRYEDACDQPQSNSHCLNCQAGWLARSSLLLFARLPHQCCFQRSRLARKDEVEKYSLSRACMWFICETCRRTFPYTNPKQLPSDRQQPACCLYAVRAVDDLIRRRLRLSPNVTTVCVLCGTPWETASPTTSNSEGNT